MVTIDNRIDARNLLLGLVSSLAEGSVYIGARGHTYMSTVLRTASQLSGIDYATLYSAASEKAYAERAYHLCEFARVHALPAAAAPAATPNWDAVIARLA